MSSVGKLTKSLALMLPPLRQLRDEIRAVREENEGLWRALNGMLNQRENESCDRPSAAIAAGLSIHDPQVAEVGVAEARPAIGIPAFTIPPIFVPYYKGNYERRRYLEAAFSQFGLPPPEFITDFDTGEFPLANVYSYDEARYRSIIELTKDIFIAHEISGALPNASWAQCFQIYKLLNPSLARRSWLKPHPLSESQVSLWLKHRSAREKIADGMAGCGIIAEDDIIFFQNSAKYLGELVSKLPEDFDYIDLAGGDGLVPRTGDRKVNGVFFEMIPPRSRTTCCAILSRPYAGRLLSLDQTICLPVDWSLNFELRATGAKVYWAHPPVFGHGSQMNYKSSTRLGP